MEVDDLQDVPVVPQEDHLVHHVLGGLVPEQPGVLLAWARGWTTTTTTSPSPSMSMRRRSAWAPGSRTPSSPSLPSRAAPPRVAR